MTGQCADLLELITCTKRDLEGAGKVNGMQSAAAVLSFGARCLIIDPSRNTWKVKRQILGLPGLGYRDLRADKNVMHYSLISHKSVNP